MAPETLRGQIVSKAIAEYIKTGNNRLGKGWKRSLARELMKKNPDTFINLNAVRQMIQERCGSKGDRHRKYAKFAHEVTYCKILILDIETAPLLGYVWSRWEQNINPEQLVSDWFIFTWSAKWLFEKKVYSAKLTGKEARGQNDERICKSIWKLLDEADMVITHNGDKFDLPKLNTRFLIHGMPPPMPYLSIDTLKHSKKQFSHSSNKLDEINKSLKAPRKMEHEGFPMWAKCYKGDEAALVNMERYNIKDVLILETLYLRMRNWIKPHPNVALYISDEKVERCPTCGSEHLSKETKGRYVTGTAIYGVFRCKSCGSLGRERVTQISRQQAKYIKISLAR